MVQEIKTLMSKARKIVIYEDIYIIVVNKPSGILSQKDKSKDADIKEYLYKQGLIQRTFCHPIHRLDRNVSGLMILAKSSEVAKCLGQDIKDSKITRKYKVLVKGEAELSGTIDLPLLKEKAENKVFVHKDGKKSITCFDRIKKYDSFSLLEVSLLTGRSHQIRCHFSHKGFPVIGDKKYGKKPWSTLLSRPALHAFYIEFTHPISKKKFHFSIDMPDDMKKFLKDIS